MIIVIIILLVLVLCIVLGSNTDKLKKQQWVNFVGPLDEETCEDCRKAIEGSPWPIEKAPQPGCLKCGDNCRHALQMIDD